MSFPSAYQHPPPQGSRSRTSSTASRYIPDNYSLPPTVRESDHGLLAPPTTGPPYAGNQSHTAPAPSWTNLQPPPNGAPYPTADMNRPVDCRRYSASSARHSESSRRHSRGSAHSHRSDRSHHSHRSHHSRRSGGSDRERHHHPHRHEDSLDHHYGKHSHRDEARQDGHDRALKRADTSRPTLGDTVVSLWGNIKAALGPRDRYY